RVPSGCDHPVGSAGRGCPARTSRSAPQFCRAPAGIMSRAEGETMRIRTVLIRSSVVLLAAVAFEMAIAQNDWPVYGRDPGAQRYSPLTQINPSNVSQLVQAWAYETKAPSVAKGQQASKSTPLMVGNVVYFVTPYQSLVAVEPE